MSKPYRFEDMQAWKIARDLAEAIYKISSEGNFCKDYALRDQIRRDSVSMMSNIGEVLEGAENKDFHRPLSVARGSAEKIKVHLHVALDLGFLSKEDFKKLCDMADETELMIDGYMRYLDQSGETI